MGNFGCAVCCYIYLFKWVFLLKKEGAFSRNSLQLHLNEKNLTYLRLFSWIVTIATTPNSISSGIKCAGNNRCGGFCVDVEKFKSTRIILSLTIINWKLNISTNWHHKIWYYYLCITVWWGKNLISTLLEDSLSPKLPFNLAHLVFTSFLPDL